MSLKISRKDLDTEINKITGKKRAKLTWCMYESPEEDEFDDNAPDWQDQYENQILELPFESFDEVFYQGKALFTHGGYWSNAKDVKKTNPTWREVIKIAEKFASGDHIFLEEILKRKGPDPGVQVFLLAFGS